MWNIMGNICERAQGNLWGFIQGIFVPLIISKEKIDKNGPTLTSSSSFFFFSFFLGGPTFT